MDPTPKSTFQIEYDKINEAIEEYSESIDYNPKIQSRRGSIRYRLAEAASSLTAADFCAFDLKTILEKEISPTALLAAKILYEAGKFQEQIFAFLLKTLRYIMAKENIALNDYVLALIIHVITSFEESASQAFPEIYELTQLQDLPPRTQHAVVYYAFRVGNSNEEIRKFADTLSTHADQSYREYSAIVQAYLFDPMFNWEAEIDTEVDSFQAKYVKSRNFYLQMESYGPGSDEDLQSAECRLLGFATEISRSEMTVDKLTLIIREKFSPAALKAAELLIISGHYKPECCSVIKKALALFVKKYKTEDSCGAFTNAINCAGRLGVEGVQLLEFVQAISKEKHLPVQLQKDIVGYVRKCAYHSVEVYKFALDLKKHRSVKLRRVAEKILDEKTKTGQDWETEVKAELVRKGLMG